MSHALLSPSAAHRWLNCPKSLRQEEKFPDSTSDAALEGTIAHNICAILLNELQEKGSYDEETVINYASHDGAAGYSFEEFDKWFSPDMMKHAEDYASYVWSAYMAELKTTPDAVLMVEKDLDLSAYGEGMHGTTDSAIVSDKILHIFDFKFGRGVRVEAEENPQMKIYALGNIEAYSGLYAFKNVIMTIFQPRIDNISDFDMTVKDLHSWGMLTLKPKASDAYNGKGDYNAGPWCKFCKAKAVCKKCARRCTESYILNKEKTPDLMSEKDIADIIAMSNDITSWLDAVKEFAGKQLLDGHPIEGLKLVEGRSVRQYSDPNKVIELLQECGYTEEQIYDKKVKGVTAMQKTLTKKVFDNILADLIIKPQGKPTLALKDDPRAEYNSIAEDFNSIDI